MTKKRSKCPSDDEEALVQNILLDGEYNPNPRPTSWSEQYHIERNYLAPSYSDEHVGSIMDDSKTFGSLKRKRNEALPSHRAHDLSTMVFAEEPLLTHDRNAETLESSKDKKRRRRLERTADTNSEVLDHQEPWPEALYTASLAGPSTSTRPLNPHTPSHLRGRIPNSGSSSIQTYPPSQPVLLEDQSYADAVDKEAIPPSSWVSSMTMVAEGSYHHPSHHFIQHEHVFPILANSNLDASIMLPPSHISLTSPIQSYTSPSMSLGLTLPAKPPPPPSIGMQPDPDPKTKRGVFHLQKPLKFVNPARTLVMESLPRRYRNLDFVRAWVKDVCGCDPLHAQMNPSCGKALVEFAKASSARAAWASPRLGSSNMGKGHDLRNIRVYWYRAQGSGPSAEHAELEEGEIDSDTVEVEIVARPTQTKPQKPQVVNPAAQPESNEKVESNKERKARVWKEKQAAKFAKKKAAYKASLQNADPQGSSTGTPVAISPVENKDSLEAIRPLSRSPLQSTADKRIPAIGDKKSHVVAQVEPITKTSHSALPPPLPPPRHEPSLPQKPHQRELSPSSSTQRTKPTLSTPAPSTASTSLPSKSNHKIVDMESPIPLLAGEMYELLQHLLGSEPIVIVQGPDAIVFPGSPPQIKAPLSRHSTDALTTTPFADLPRPDAIQPRVTETQLEPGVTKLALLARERELHQRIARQKAELSSASSDHANGGQDAESDQKAMEESLRQRVLLTQRRKVLASRPKQPSPTPPASVSACSARSTSSTPRPRTPEVSSENMPPNPSIVRVNTPDSLDALAASFIAETIQTVTDAPPRGVSHSVSAAKPPSAVKSDAFTNQQRLDHLIAYAKKLVEQLGQARTKDEKERIRAQMCDNNRAVEQAFAAASRAPLGNHIGENGRETKSIHSCWTRWPQLEQQPMIIVSDDEDSDMEE
ncbi:hypothetical protein HGRIS_011563 [Hohenbuehelia grisea]|uniref:RRM domain-containing protein n=1 Tax=Hohenbuehelia grisea TaxID=104357 RepID=A0ABR3JVN1_9AGAR